MNKYYPIAIAVLALVGLTAQVALAAVSAPPSGAPAPLLAAGIPAFLALGGGALATKLIRKFRGQKE
jgi:hypothetical protein